MNKSCTTNLPYTMRAIVIHEPGGPEKLIEETLPVPELRSGWSLVHIMARGLNHSEVFTRQGLSPSVQFPRVLGIECVGKIALSTDEKRLPTGQHVVSLMGEMGRAFDGSYAEYVLIPNEQIYPVTSMLPWVTLAALPETYYTAFGSFKNLRLEDGQSVLVRGATSGVGVAFAQLVRAAFPHVHLLGSTRSAKRTVSLLQAGFDEVVFDVDGHVQLEGRQLDRVLELIGPATLKDSCRVVREYGIVCSTGQLGGAWYMDGFDPIVDLPPNGYLTSFYSDNVDQLHLDELFSFVEREHVDVAPARVFSLSHMADAHAFLEDSDGFGKVVVVNDEEDSRR